MKNLEKELEKSAEFKEIKELESVLRARNLKASLSLDEAVSLNFEPQIYAEFKSKIEQIALNLKPWRKGPFKINDFFIDSEWQSFVKFNLLRPYMSELKGKIIADIGCNNGYYMFKMLEFAPAQIIGFEPCLRPILQFYFLNALANVPQITLESLGVEHLSDYKLKFDIIFCLGVLYHRSDPIKMLKNLKMALNKGGSVFLDTMYIEDEREIALIPRKTYSKISNIFFIPSILALRNWCERAGFSHFEVLATRLTDEFEQRQTSFSEGYSLKDFLSEDKSLTSEGYPAPRRVYVKLKV